MGELILLGESENVYEKYIEKYIKDNNIVAMPFPDQVERDVTGSHELNIASLHQSIRLALVKANPRKTITEHFEVFGRIMKILDDKNVEYELSNIFGEKAKLMTLPEAQREGKLITEPVVNHINTIVGRIDLLKTESDERNLSIGIGYNPKGIDVCFGTNITVCSNMSLFGGTYLTSYGRDKVSLPEMFSQIEGFINDAAMIDEKNNQLLNMMMEITLNHDQVKMLIGDMKLRAVGKAYFKQEAPLNNDNISAFTVKYLEYVKREKTDDITIYNLYNIGTAILTHQSNLRSVWSSINAFGEYFVDTYLTT